MLGLPPVPDLSGIGNPRSAFNPLVLAYFGDAVWEVHARRHELAITDHKRSRGQRLQHAELSAATYQAQLHDRLTASGNNLVTTEEADVLRWGRNAAASIPKHLDALTYKKATAVEVLVAYLYLTNRRRCSDLVQQLLAGGATGADSNARESTSL